MYENGYNYFYENSYAINWSFLLKSFGKWCITNDKLRNDFEMEGVKYKAELTF